MTTFLVLLLIAAGFCIVSVGVSVSALFDILQTGDEKEQEYIYTVATKRWARWFMTAVAFLGLALLYQGCVSWGIL